MKIRHKLMITDILFVLTLVLLAYVCGVYVGYTVSQLDKPEYIHVVDTVYIEQPSLDTFYAMQEPTDCEYYDVECVSGSY